MARSEKQKEKLFTIYRILAKRTDEEHRISVNQIVEELRQQEIPAERKSVYDDIETLRDLGVDVELRRGRGGGYWLNHRRFELPELKLLVDSVQASRFITAKKSQDLIRKLCDFTSDYQAAELNRQVYASSRIKTMNESIYYNVDALHRAIAEDRQVSFVYKRWVLRSGRVEKAESRLGNRYVVSPWALLWEDENYYLVGYEEQKGLRHYRVDRMEDIDQLEAVRLGVEVYDPANMRNYAKPMFGMFSGPVQRVTLEFDMKLLSAMIDRFGQGIIVVPVGTDKGRIQVEVAVSPLFYGWLTGFGSRVRILGPQTVKNDYQRHLQETLAAQQQP